LGLIRPASNNVHYVSAPPSDLGTRPKGAGDYEDHGQAVNLKTPLCGCQHVFNNSHNAMLATTRQLGDLLEELAGFSRRSAFSTSDILTPKNIINGHIKQVCQPRDVLRLQGGSSSFPSSISLLGDVEIFRTWLCESPTCSRARNNLSPKPDLLNFAGLPADMPPVYGVSEKITESACIITKHRVILLHVKNFKRKLDGFLSSIKEAGSAYPRRLNATGQNKSRSSSSW